MTIRRKVTARGQRQAMGARRSVLPPRRLTATETGGYSGVTIKWRMRHSDDRHARRAVVVAGRRRRGARSNHGCRVAARGAAGSVLQAAAQTDRTRAEKPQPPALTADEERFATALWAVHREATRLAVSMSFAGIVYQTEDRDARALARKIEPMAKFFHDAEMQVRSMSTPPSLSTAHGQYVDAMALYANAAAEMLKFTEDGDQQRLGNAHRMDVTASEDMLRVGEVLWPGQYKPH